MTVQELLAWLVILVAVPLHWIVAALLWRRSTARPDIAVLRERTVSGVALALVVTIFALVFLNNGMEVPILDPPATQLLTRTAILSLSIPALLWIWLYRQ